MNATEPERSSQPVNVETATDGAAWDAYASQHELGTADHLWGWQQVIRSALGHECRYLVARRGSTITGLLPLVLFKSRLFGKSVISMPFLNYGGLLVSDSTSGDALVQAATGVAQTFGASHVELRHVAAQCPTLPNRQHKLRMALPLAGTSEVLWTGIDRKIRNQVRKAQKEGLTTADGGLELVDEFYAVFSQNMRDLGTPVYPKSLFQETVRAFPDRARIFIVRKGTQPIACGFIVTFNKTALNPWASSLREFRNLCPNVLLYWTMIERAVNEGAQTFDFGRSSPGGGTHTFKEQWGAEAIPMHWEYVLLSRPEPPNHGPSNPKFERVIDLWKRLPLPVANTLGPFIAPHLP